MVSTFELVFQPDGSIARIGVVRSSGVLVYDFAAYTAIRRATPFPAPPEAIRSGDGKTYLHWDLMRSPPFCRTDNARPFILDNAPAEGADDDGGAQLGGSSVPEGAQPTWGTVQERGPVRSAEDAADPEQDAPGEPPSPSSEETPPPEEGAEEAEGSSETAPAERTPPD